MRLISLLSLALAATGCVAGGVGGSPSVEQEAGVRYVALGDSYTIGTSVAVEERWPNQLAERLPEVELVGNLGVNGYTSADLIARELPALDSVRPELVSVLIGVNDVVRGVSEVEYAANVTLILEELLGRLPPSRIVCVATPDYTLTPQGAAYGEPVTQRAAIVRFNEVLANACERRGIAFVPEPFAISGEVPEDADLVASDGLHPSGRQYARWVDAIRPVVEDLLRRDG
jgi:lysophospholipase L1-like esterase